MNKKNNPIQISVIILTASILGLSLFTPPYLDYFYFKGGVEKDGIYQFILTHYFYLDGRFASIPALIQIALIKFLPHTLIISIYALIFLSFSFFFTKSISYFNNNRWTYGLLILIILSFFYGFHTHIRNTVYWAVGGVYSLHLLFTIIWVLFLDKWLNNKFRSKYHFFAICLSFIIGGVSQNLFPALIIYYAYLFIIRKDIIIINKITTFIATVTGFIITAIAPGNFRRMDAFEGAIDLSPLNLSSNFFGITVNYLNYSFLLFLFIAITAIYHGIFIKNTIPNRLDNLDNRKHFTISIVFILMAFSTIVPMIIIPKQAAPRTAIFFMLFNSLALFNFIAYYTAKYKNKLKVRPIIKTSIPIIALLLHLVIIPRHYISANITYKNQKENEEMIMEQIHKGEKNIVIKEIRTPKATFTTQYTSCPLSSDANYFANQQLSLYYNVDAIIAIK